MCPFSRSVGLCAAFILALLPPFFLTSIEFRADNLWVVFWLLALVVLVERNVTPVRGWAVGALLGLAMAASLKTVCLLAALSLGCFVGTCLLASPVERAYARLASLLAALAGFAIVIALLLASLAELRRPVCNSSTVRSATMSSLSGSGASGYRDRPVRSQVFSRVVRRRAISFGVTRT